MFEYSRDSQIFIFYSCVTNPSAVATCNSKVDGFYSFDIGIITHRAGICCVAVFRFGRFYKDRIIIVFSKSRNGFLCQEDFAANRTMFTFGEAGCSTSGSNRFVNNFGMCFTNNSVGAVDNIVSCIEIPISIFGNKIPFCYCSIEMNCFQGSGSGKCTFSNALQCIGQVNFFYSGQSAKCTVQQLCCIGNHNGFQSLRDVICYRSSRSIILGYRNTAIIREVSKDKAKQGGFIWGTRDFTSANKRQGDLFQVFISKEHTLCHVGNGGGNIDFRN